MSPIGRVRELLHRRPGLAVLAALALGLAGWLRVGFLLDDFFHLDRAGRGLMTGALDYAIRTDDYGIVLWIHPAAVHFQFFRPLSSWSLWIERRVWGLHPFGYHLTNLVLHLFNAWLVAGLARRCGVRRGVALACACAWALSLQTVPAVGWISGRTELLWGAFTLVAATALLHWQRGAPHAWLALALASCGAAGLSKESGLAAPVIALLFARLVAQEQPARRGRSGVWLTVVMLLPSLAVLAMRFAWVRAALPPPPYLDIPQEARDVVWLLAKPFLYLAAAALSLPLSHWGPLDWIRAHLVVLAIPAAVAAVVSLVLARAAGRASAVLLLGAFVAALLPTMPVRPTSLYLYVPLVPLAILIGRAAQSHAPFRAWLAGWIVVGLATHFFAQGFLTRVSRDADAQATAIERVLRERRPSRLLVIDAPVWQYALPAALRLRAPDLTFETWFVNFAPRLDAAAASRTRWSDGATLELDAGSGRFLDSQFEHFLAFGGVPAPASIPSEAPVRITSGEVGARPRRLVVHFRDRESLRASTVVRLGARSLALLEPPEAGPPSPRP